MYVKNVNVPRKNSHSWTETTEATVQKPQNNTTDVTRHYCEDTQYGRLTFLLHLVVVFWQHFLWQAYRHTG